MGNSCSIIPKVKGNDGSIKDSRLFKDLLSFSNNDRNELIKQGHNRIAIMTGMLL